MLLSNLFEVKNGIPSNLVEISQEKDDFFSVPYIRPSSSYNNLIAGFIDPKSVNQRYIFEKETLFVSTDGDGSHSYSYVAPMDFIPNSNVSVLIPKRQMSLKEKLFYSECITRNRYRFSYGRKPKGDRLKNIDLPERVPEEFKKITFIQEENFSSSKSNKKFTLSEKKWHWFKYDDIFDLSSEPFVSIEDAEKFPGDFPFISTSGENNGVACYTSIESAKTYPAGCLTVASSGSVGEVFYQDTPFKVTNMVIILKPKFEINKYIGLFLKTLIYKEKYRYSYGRKSGIERMKESKIKLPVEPSGEPDWQWIEEYIKGLPYSSSI